MQADIDQTRLSRTFEGFIPSKPEIASSTEDMPTVLIVDNEKGVLESMERLLKPEGYRVITASTSREGIEALGKAEVALVISDATMPEMDAFKFLARVRELSPCTVRFMLLDTNGAAPEKGKKVVMRYLSKPWDDELLKTAVKDSVKYYRLVRRNMEISCWRRRPARRLFAVPA